MSDEVHIQFTRFSAFYSPLIATIAGGFLAREGLSARHSVAPPGRSAIEGVVTGAVHVCQSAPSQGFGPLEKGQTPPAGMAMAAERLAWPALLRKLDRIDPSFRD